jgi:FkbM family methyltransferase
VLRSLARRIVASRLPGFARAYRSFREEMHISRIRAHHTPFGFALAGPTGMQDGSFEADEVGLVRKLLKDAAVVVDIGANIGFYTCMARQAGKQVVAIEPVRSNLDLLYRNLESNGWSDVEVWPLGLSNASGIGTIYGARTGASLLPGWAHNSELFRTSISLSTLDELLRGRFQGQHLLVKIDVEGAEYDVLRGSLETLDRKIQPTWLVEITLDLNREGLNPHFADTFQVFMSRGYRAYATTPVQREISIADIGEWISKGRVDSGCYNWLFLPGT